MNANYKFRIGSDIVELKALLNAFNAFDKALRHFTKCEINARVLSGSNVLEVSSPETEIFAKAMDEFETLLNKCLKDDIDKKDVDKKKYNGIKKLADAVAGFPDISIAGVSYDFAHIQKNLDSKNIVGGEGLTEITTTLDDVVTLDLIRGYLCQIGEKVDNIDESLNHFCIQTSDDGDFVACQIAKNLNITDVLANLGKEVVVRGLVTWAKGTSIRSIAAEEILDINSDFRIKNEETHA